VIIRVGDEAAETGVLDGFDDNPLCAVVAEGLVATESQLVSCGRPVTGRYVSIRVVDYIKPTQLKLCSVDVITA